MQLDIKAMMWCFSLCVVTLHGYYLADVPGAVVLSTWDFLPPNLAQPYLTLPNLTQTHLLYSRRLLYAPLFISSEHASAK